MSPSFKASLLYAAIVLGFASTQALAANEKQYDQIVDTLIYAPFSGTHPLVWPAGHPQGTFGLPAKYFYFYKPDGTREKLEYKLDALTGIKTAEVTINHTLKTKNTTDTWLVKDGNSHYKFNINSDVEMSFIISRNVTTNTSDGPSVDYSFYISLVGGSENKSWVFRRDVEGDNSGFSVLAIQGGTLNIKAPRNDITFITDGMSPVGSRIEANLYVEGGTVNILNKRFPII